MKPKPIKMVSGEMTNEPEMTLETAREIAAKPCENDSHCQLAWKHGFGSGFISGHAAASKEADVYKEALKKISSTNGLQYSDIFKICDETLSKGRTK